MTETKIKPTNAAHEAFFEEMCAVLQKHHESLPDDEMLMLAANLVGRLVAMQDQRRFTVEQLMNAVIRNIQKGNAQMISQLIDMEPMGHA